MTPRIYALIFCALTMCGLLLAAVLLPPEIASAPWGTQQSSTAQSAPESLPGMVWVPGGTFLMGGSELPPPDRNPDRIKEDEYPAHLVELDGF